MFIRDNIVTYREQESNMPTSYIGDIYYAAPVLTVLVFLAIAVLTTLWHSNG
jgi:hypothetical protein